MKNCFLIFLFVLSTLDFRAQINLVPNPSFEDIDSCYGQPSGLGFDVFQWSGCSGWKNPTYASSDLWCSSPVAGPYEPPNLPGYIQSCYENDNMAAIYILDAAYPYYREYIQCELLTALQTGKKYEINFWVNCAESYNVSSSIGAYFSSLAVGNTTSFNYLPYIPQIENPESNFITDTLGWQLISGQFYAQGGEKFLTIGNFRDSASMVMSAVYGDSLYASIYFHIDGVELIEVPYSFQAPNIFTPNQDNQNDFFSFNVKNIQNWSCAIYNRWGIKVSEFSEGTNHWDGRTSSGLECSVGVYYYVFSTFINEKEIIEKGFVQLLR